MLCAQKHQKHTASSSYRHTVCALGVSCRTCDETYSKSQPSLLQPGRGSAEQRAHHPLLWSVRRDAAPAAAPSVAQNAPQVGLPEPAPKPWTHYTTPVPWQQEQRRGGVGRQGCGCQALAWTLCNTPEKLSGTAAGQVRSWGGDGGEVKMTRTVLLLSLHAPLASHPLSLIVLVEKQWVCTEKKHWVMLPLLYICWTQCWDTMEWLQ